MSNLDKVKELRKISGAGFKDCNNALKETNGNIEKSIELLRVKGISKATKKMSRVANEGLISIFTNETSSSIIEINCETDFVAKNEDFIKFCKELSELNFLCKGNLDKINNSKMANNLTVKDNLVSLISKIGEKIIIRRAKFFDNNNGFNFFYVHSAIEKNIGKIISVVKLDGIIKGKNEEIGSKIAMHIAASNPLAIDREGIDKKIVDKEMEIIKAEIVNSGKPDDLAEKISKGKISKFLNDSSLLNQIWIMDPKKKVLDILKEYSANKEIKVIDFEKYKVGEGV